MHRTVFIDSYKQHASLLYGITEEAQLNGHIMIEVLVHIIFCYISDDKALPPDLAEIVCAWFE